MARAMRCTVGTPPPPPKELYPRPPTSSNCPRDPMPERGNRRGKNRMGKQTQERRKNWMYFISIGDVLIVLKRRQSPVGSQFEVHVLRTAQCGHLAGGESGQMASATAPVRGHKRVTGWVTLPKSGPPSAFKLHDFDSLQRKKTEPKLDPDPTRLDTVPNQAHREFLPAVLTSPASPFRNPTLDPNIRSLYFPYHHTQHTPPQ